MNQALNPPWPGWTPSPPTPFTAVDELSCYYDCPAEPNTVHIEVQLPGHLNYPELRRAVIGALAEQPRARASRAPGGRLRRRYAWQYPARPDTDPVARETWADEWQLARLRQAFLAVCPPLESSPPVRLLLAAGPAGDCLILSAHHAALDGLSCLRLLRRIGELYRRPGQHADRGPADGHAQPASQGKPVMHAERASPAEPASAASPSQARAGSQADAGGQAIPAPAGRPGRLALPLPARIAAAAGARRDGYGLHLITLADLPPVPRAGSGRPATVNDLLIAAAILAIGRWNAARGRPARQIRISMPLNARPPGCGDAAGNLSRIVTVSAFPPDQAGMSGLVLQVARQTSAAKQAAGPQVGAGSRWLTAVPLPAGAKRLVLRALLRTIGPVQCDTSMVTNLGYVSDPPRFGLAGQVRLAFSSSAHMPRGLSIGAVAADGRLQLALRYRYALFDDDAAAEFAAVYVAALTELGGQAATNDTGRSLAALADGQEGTG
jgi:NRPS condensation-like uncharacterized protein